MPRIVPIDIMRPRAHRAFAMHVRAVSGTPLGGPPIGQLYRALLLLTRELARWCSDRACPLVQVGNGTLQSSKWDASFCGQI
jgi:hypothetical protein